MRPSILSLNAPKTAEKEGARSKPELKFLFVGGLSSFWQQPRISPSYRDASRVWESKRCLSRGAGANSSQQARDKGGGVCRTPQTTCPNITCNPDHRLQGPHLTEHPTRPGTRPSSHHWRSPDKEAGLTNSPRPTQASALALVSTALHSSVSRPSCSQTSPPSRQALALCCLGWGLQAGPGSRPRRSAGAVDALTLQNLSCPLAWSRLAERRVMATPGAGARWLF